MLRFMQSSALRKAPLYAKLRFMRRSSTLPGAPLYVNLEAPVYVKLKAPLYAKLLFTRSSALGVALLYAELCFTRSSV